MQTMTSRERLKRCYFHEQIDRPGVYCRTGFPADDATYDQAKAYLAQFTDQKRGWSGVRREAAAQEHSVEPFSADFERRVTTLRTPAGGLQSTRLVSLKGQPGLHETFFIKSPADAERYLSLPVTEPTVSGVDAFHELVQDMGETGIVEVGLGMNPAGTIATLCGSETFALLSITDRELLHALCQRHMEMKLAEAKALIRAGVGPFFCMLGQEFVVPPLHGCDDFYDFNVKYDKPITDLVHAAGGRVHVHSHGRVGKVMRGFVDCGADVLHPFEGPPMGDITPREAKDIARGTLCLEGNIQIGDMYEATPDEIREQTQGLIADVFDDGRGLIVCPTASPYIRGRGQSFFSRFQAMVDTVLAYPR